ncbi:LPXTG cell wall anchor domain-containing protein [Candidatus Gracilibacteria bacterium]|nr:LPXTG cell wall anchor domain-containing protein [Candidatus Gracilibacteria bacterium]
MIRISLIAMMMILQAAVLSTVSAETGTTTGTNTPTATTQSSEKPLLLSTVTVSDASHVSLLFNQAIRIDSLRVRIIDQSTNESVKVLSITGALDPMTAVLETSTSLTAGASYVLTITSALSTTDMTIKAGIDSIREFAVPVTVKGAVLNAPTNPNAVIVATGTSISPKPTMTQSGTVKSTATGAMVISQDTKSLPATGTPTTVLILLAAVSALALLLMRKRA